MPATRPTRAPAVLLPPNPRFPIPASANLAHLPGTLRKYGETAHHWRIRSKTRLFAPRLDQHWEIRSKMRALLDQTIPGPAGIRGRASEVEHRHPKPGADPCQHRATTGKSLKRLQRLQKTGEFECQTVPDFSPRGTGFLPVAAVLRSVGCTRPKTKPSAARCSVFDVRRSAFAFPPPTVHSMTSASSSVHAVSRKPLKVSPNASAVGLKNTETPENTAPNWVRSAKLLSRSPPFRLRRAGVLSAARFWVPDARD